MYATPSSPRKHHSQRVHSALLCAGAALLALAPAARAAEPEQFELTQQTHVLARAHANDAPDIIQQDLAMATATAHGDEHSQCNAGDENVSSATAQARVVRDFAAPSRQGYTLTVEAAAGGGHWVRCGGCQFGICFGRFPYDTAADSTAGAELAIDVHFPPDARPIPYKVRVGVERVQLSGVVPVVELRSADGRSLLGQDPLQPVSVEGGPGRDLRLTVSLVADANHRGVDSRVVAGGTIRVVLSLERAPLLEALVDDPINSGTDVHNDFLPVGALLWDGHPHCTGTLIGPRTVLTAAHCVYGYSDPSRMIFVQGDKSSSSKGRTEVTESFYPQIGTGGIGFAYDDKTLTNDLAIVHLRTPCTPAYELADPSRHPELPAIQSLVDSQTPLTFVGFGNQLVQGDEVASGVKRQIPFPIALIETGKFFYENHRGTTCHGDSGGPALLKDKDVLYVLGIASGGEAHCDGYGSLTRLDNPMYLKWIKPLIQ